MLFIRLWNYIRGYVIILVEGFFLEKFINICAHRQIFLWDAIRKSSSSMTLKMSVKGFKLIRPVARKSRCKVKIVKKKGIPFVLARYRKRVSFWVGLFLFCIILLLLCSFIWVIEVDIKGGQDDIQEQDIIQKLEDIGIKPGVLKYSIDTQQAANELLLSMDQLGWVGIHIKGTKFKVEASKRTVPPVLLDRYTPCDIVAAKDGVISSLVVKEGLEKVKPGDTVQKGQLLISGMIPVKNNPDEYRQVHAIAEVKARTWYESRVPVAADVLQKVFTRRVNERYYVIVFNKLIPLPARSSSFEQKDVVYVTRKLEILKDMVLPFGYMKKQEIEYVNNYIRLDLEEARSRAVEQAKEEVIKYVPEGAKIIKTNIAFDKNENNNEVAIVTLECEEEIGIQKKIGGN